MKTRNLYQPLPEDARTGSERLGGGGNVASPKTDGEKHSSRKAGREGQPGQLARNVKNSPGRK
jgi:hypothetical protein